MLKIVIPATESFNKTTRKLIRHEPETLLLEHSLLSVSKWESKWEIPFFSKTDKPKEQVLSYVQMMSEVSVSEDVASRLSSNELDQVNEYLNKKHSATWFSNSGESKANGPIVTSELIYYWMTAFSIPFECQTWPIARLMNLITIAQIKSDTGKKKGVNKTAMLSERASLNAKRRAEKNSKG